MKSNYRKAAEIKIAKNPDMSEVAKRCIMAEVFHKEMYLNFRLYGMHFKPSPYTRHDGLNAHSYFVDEFVLDEPENDTIEVQDFAYYRRTSQLDPIPLNAYQGHVLGDINFL